MTWCNWKIPKHVEKRLGALEGDVPSQAGNFEEFNLFVSLWCGRTKVDLNTDTIDSLEFGFQIGEVHIELERCDIAREGRLKSEAYRENITRAKSNESGHEIDGGASAELNTKASWLPAQLSFSAGAKARKKAEQTIQEEGKYAKVIWRVADRGPNFWRVFGFGLNGDGVLENRIIGDQPLCKIIARKNAKSLSIKITYRCDLRDLWIQPLDTSGNQKKLDQRFDPSQAELNRRKIAGILIAKALNKESKKLNSHTGDGMVILSEHKMKANKILNQ